MLVAVSGGVDSVVLVTALRDLADRSSLKLSIGHVNHGLRGLDSEADEVWVGELAAGLGLPFGVRQVEVSARREGQSSRERPTVQEAARELRYAALWELADSAGADAVATAHTADDQVETVLLRLLRGTGPDGLGGIPPSACGGRLVRPLLAVSKSEVTRFARERGLAWREDASNDSDDYARNRLRRHWLPGLARDFNPRLSQAIARLAEAQRSDSEWMSREVSAEAGRRFRDDAGGLWIDAAGWTELPDPLALRLAKCALERCGARRHVTRAHLVRMSAFLGTGQRGKRIELPGRLLLWRGDTGFHLGANGAR